MNLAELTGLAEARRAIRIAIRRGTAPLEASLPQGLDAWAEEKFYLSAESSYVEGGFVPYPFQRGPMQCISNDGIEEVDWRKSSRVGYTKILLAAIGYFAEHKRRNQVVYQPTDDDADDFVKTELDPMLRDVAPMERVFPAYLRRHKDNTLRQKKFLGSVCHIRGGKAAKNYRRLTVDVVMIDEVDAFDLDVENEGSPVSLARKRLEGATFPKLVIGSTPKLKGFSLIEAREQQAVMRLRYHVPCPHCGEEHVLTWGGRESAHGMKWTDGDPETAAQVCPSCGSLYTQAEYLRVWERGRWKDSTGVWLDDAGRFRGADDRLLPTPLSVAFHVWTAYSPQTTWPAIVREFLGAVAKARAGDKGELKAFHNTTLGESWEEEAEKADAGDLQARAEPYPLGRVPAGGLVLTAGVDVQGRRFEVVVWAWGRGEEAWAVDHAVIDANPADDRDWDERLHPYLQRRFEHAHGAELRIEATAIDTGGHFTHQAYNFVRRHRGARYFAIRGNPQLGQPVKGRSSLQDVSWRGKVIKQGVRLWAVGTDTAKDLFFGRLQVREPGPGRVHFSSELPRAFFDQLSAEARMLMRTPSGEQYRWVKQHERNEALDCTVYAIFSAHALDLHRYTDRLWARLDAAVAPDLFAREPPPATGPEQDAGHAPAADAAEPGAPGEADAAPTTTKPAPAVPRRNWATNWRS